MCDEPTNCVNCGSEELWRYGEGNPLHCRQCGTYQPERSASTFSADMKLLNTLVGLIRSNWSDPSKSSSYEDPWTILCRMERLVKESHRGQ